MSGSSSVLPPTKVPPPGFWFWVLIGFTVAFWFWLSPPPVFVLSPVPVLVLLPWLVPPGFMVPFSPPSEPPPYICPWYNPYPTIQAVVF